MLPKLKITLVYVSLLFFWTTTKAHAGVCVFPNPTPEYTQYLTLKFFSLFLVSALVFLGLGVFWYKKFSVKYEVLISLKQLVKRLLFIIIFYGFGYAAVFVYIFLFTVVIVGLVSKPFSDALFSVPGALAVEFLCGALVAGFILLLINNSKIFGKPYSKLQLFLLLTIIPFILLLVSIQGNFIYDQLVPFKGQEYLPCG